MTTYRIIVEAEADDPEIRMDFVDVIQRMAPYYFDNVLVISEVVEIPVADSIFCGWCHEPIFLAGDVWLDNGLGQGCVADDGSDQIHEPYLLVQK